MSPARSVRRTRVIAAVTALAALCGLGITGPVAQAAEKPVRGARGSGDSMLPKSGNGGYDVRHYGLDLHYRPAHNALRARTVVRAVATHPLSSFSLDLQGLRVRRVVVDGEQARFNRHGQELVITPDRAVSGRFTAVVRYAGHPRRHVDADGSPEGWLTMPDGATALNEPVGSMTWFPVNNTPRDKARYTIRITAPSRLAVASNGVLARRVRHGDRTTWTWRQSDPMAADLALVSIGRYDVFRSHVRSVTGRRIPSWTFVQKSLPSQRKHRRMLPEILRWQERRFGTYPFHSTGLVFHKLAVGYSLETQDRPFFPGNIDTLTVVHELAHQWFGDSVTPSDLGDICLNEGFATYVEWLWRADHGGRSAAKSFRQAYRSHGPRSAFWQPAPNALPDSSYLFSTPVYVRGAMTLQALRERVGKDAFFEIVRAWLRDHRHGNVTTAMFVRLSERVSGEDLGTLFKDWLSIAARPAGY